MYPKRRNTFPISMLVATQICQPKSLPQAPHFPSFQDFFWYFPVPGFWPILPPTCPPPLPLLEPSTRYWVRSTYKHPPTGSCRFCQSSSIGDEFHAFKCTAFMDLQVLCGVNVTSFPNLLLLCNLLRSTPKGTYPWSCPILSSVKTLWVPPTPPLFTPYTIYTLLYTLQHFLYIHHPYIFS